MPRLTIFANIILFATTTYWSILGAHLHQANADQLIDPYLFSSSETFSGAQFPPSHSFLLKWPVFWLIDLLGKSDLVYILFTVIFSLITVFGLNFLINRFCHNRHNHPIITLCLASIFLLVPPTPYAGAVLPLNFAMLANRNIEYLLFAIGATIILSNKQSSRHYKKIMFISTSLLSILFATDKLFVLLFACGVIGLIGFAKIRHNNRIFQKSNVLLCLQFLLSFLSANILLNILNVSGITNIQSSSQLSPYQFNTSPNEIGQAIFFAATNILTLFGANPAYDALVIRDIPKLTVESLLSLRLPILVVNFLIFCLSSLYFFRFIVRIVRSKKSSIDSDDKIIIFFVMASLASLASFILTKHYYPVDGRYLVIVMISLMMIFSKYLSHSRFNLIQTNFIVFGLCLAIFFGLLASTNIHKKSAAALDDIYYRNKTISQIMSGFSDYTLAGDYWRVVPINHLSGSKLKIYPQGGCLQPAQYLTSTAWVPKNNQDIVYLISDDHSLTNYQDCQIEQYYQNYGSPTIIYPILAQDGQIKDRLLIYSSDSSKLERDLSYLRTIQASDDKVIKLNNEPQSLTISDILGCPDNQTILNVIAHPDDDILFMNPDVNNDIITGKCVRTLFLSAGDSGAPEGYYKKRQFGSREAYNQMRGTFVPWVERTTTIGSNSSITILNPKDSTKISHIYLSLPDGNLRGEGFGNNSNTSLAKLYSGQIATISSNSNSLTFTKDQLVQLIEDIITASNPTVIRTQSSYENSRYYDHSDHKTTGKFTTDALSLLARTGSQIPKIEYYMGYPAQILQPNVVAEELNTKTNIFLTYSQQDIAVCSSNPCQLSSTYQAFLARQYTTSY